ncbi:hypothetical protein [Mesorhizobium sp.]|uniref:hypothetical protein n=1 Tax=Mesorhizobium sp. TaxID=1871066 RepID=UPI000FEA97DC|nr:hypothetical protein [Mesorhizobium sp.]RWO89540.1 MAG: hypothetical protein EOQ96_05110 [Mesorhizobium sp.]
MERLSTKQTLAMLGLTHRNALRGRIKDGKLTPIVDAGRNYYDRAEVERCARGEPAPTIFTSPSATMLATGEPEGGWPE